MAMTLFYSPGACSLAAHIALREAGAKYEVRRVSVHEGETQGDEYLRINPRGRVPALDIDGTILTETCAILMYIAHTFPEADLLPKPLLAQMQCLSTMAWFASTVHPTFAHIVRPSRFADDEAAHETLKETARKTYWALLQEVDSMIGKGPWVLGEQFTLCDGYALPFWGFGRRIRLPMNDLSNYTQWKARMLTRPAVLDVLQKEGSLLLRPE